MNLTEEIFKLSAPYDNPYQGKDPRILFVCSGGILRSATAANLYAKKGYNTRSCGSHPYALIPLSVNLIMWADKIVFVNKENYDEACEVFKEVEARSYHWGGYTHHILSEMQEKSIVLNIPDKYEYNHPELIKYLEEQLASSFSD